VNQLSTKRMYRRTAVIFSIILAVMFTFIIAQSLIASGTDTEDVRDISSPVNQTGVVTDTNDALAAYMAGHYLPPDVAALYLVTPTVQPPQPTPPAESDQPVAPPAVIDSTTLTYFIYMPLVFNPPPIVALTVSRANSANQWTVSWEDGGTGVTGYELQEAQNPNFSDAVTIYDGPNLNYTVSGHAASPNNEYYYRVRTKVGSLIGSWSATGMGVGAYYDEFDDPTTGWDRRRVTHIDETTTWYEIIPSEGKDWLIVQSLDSWDWVIASPLRRAPQPPYMIEYRIKVANLGNLVSSGAVFGGDWNGSLCPDKSSVAGWYQHTACFNHFYNTNTIWFSDLKLLFERVDTLVWCPECMGSPMKRLGDIETDPNKVPLLNNVAPNDWNTYRIEVRDNSIKFYANGVLQNIVDGSTVYDDTRWINDPYFGIFASTDEYSNSTARVEYYKITPLD